MNSQKIIKAKCYKDNELINMTFNSLIIKILRNNFAGAIARDVIKEKHQRKILT